MNIAHVLASKGGAVVTIRPEQSIREALAALDRHNIGALVVEEEERLVGIISERDIVRAAVRDERMFDRLVRDLMTRNVIVGSPADDLKAVAHTMTEKRVRHLPVVDSGRLVGIVSIGDVVKAQRDEYEGEVETLEMRIRDEHP